MFERIDRTFEETKGGIVVEANEAPEKIYCVAAEGGYYLTTNKSEPPFAEAVEYTRTDAFIEKACEFLKTNAGEHIYFDECNNEWYDTEELINDFKDYMKGK